MASYSDDFNRGNGVIGGDYTAMTGLTMPVVTSNQVACGGLSGHAARVTLLAFNSNQKSSIKMRACAASCGIMAGVRFQSATMSGYAFQFSGAFSASQPWELKRITSNVGTVLASGTASTAAGDTISITAVGPVITAYLNGAIVAQTTDATYSGGSPGFYIFVSGSVSNVTADDFSCTDDGFVADDFNRANDSSLGINYSIQYGLSDMKLLSGKAVPTTYGADCGALYTAADFDNDQWGEIVIGALGSPGVVGAGLGVLLRGDTALETFYRCYGSLAANSIKIVRCLAGIGTTIATFTGAGLAVNDVLRFSVAGSTLTVHRNGGQVLQSTDSNISSGRPGLTYSSTDSSTTDAIADFNAFGARPISGFAAPQWAGVLARVTRNL